jgi:peptide/nickel transport system substrate-binding protein
MSLDEAAANPIGSGPYRLASWTRGSEVVLEKVENPNSPANMQRIVWRIIPEASTRSAELIAGNVDIITNVAPDQIDAVNASGNAEVQAVQGTRRMYVGFNLSRTNSRPSRAATRSRTRPCAARSSTRSTCPRSASSFSTSNASARRAS